MNRGLKRATVAALLALGLADCVSLTPGESCAAVCQELAQCQIAMSRSSLSAGPSCESDCLTMIDTRGAACKTSAAYLADCFRTYTCDGNAVGCSDNADAFAQDCG